MKGHIFHCQDKFFILFSASTKHRSWLLFQYLSPQKLVIILIFIYIYLLNYFRWGNGVGTHEDKMPYMSLHCDDVNRGTVYHELFHVLSYNFAPTVKQEAFYWYIESSANWFTSVVYDKNYITGNAGVFYAKPYLSLWQSHIDKVILTKNILNNQNPN